MEEEKQIEDIKKDNQKLAGQLLYLGDENLNLSAKLNIALEGLKALYSGGEPTGIAKATIEEIEKVDNKNLPQE